MTRLPNKRLHGLRIQILQLRLQARSSIPGTDTNQLVFDEIINQRCINGRPEHRQIVEATADQFISRTTNQFPHLRMFSSVLRPLDVNQSWHTQFGRQIELALHRREPLLIFPAVLVSQQTEINIAVSDLPQVDIVSPSVGGRQSLEQEHIKELFQQRVSPQVLAQAGPLGRKLLLHAADKNTLHGKWRPVWKMSQIRALHHTISAEYVKSGRPARLRWNFALPLFAANHNYGRARLLPSRKPVRPPLLLQNRNRPLTRRRSQTIRGSGGTSPSLCCKSQQREGAAPAKPQTCSTSPIVFKPTLPITTGR